MRNLNIGIHAATGDKNLSIECLGVINDLLNAVEERTECRNNNATLCLADKTQNDFGDFFFTRAVSRPCSIRRIGYYCKDAFFAEFGESLKVRWRFIEGGQIEFKVSRMNDRPVGGMEGNGGGIGDTVGDSEKLHFDFPDPDAFGIRDGGQG